MNPFKSLGDLVSGSARRAGDAVSDAVSDATRLVGDSARRATDAVADATSSVGKALPTLDDAKRGLGQALVFGGKALMDPQRVVGELAVSMGESLTPAQAQAQAQAQVPGAVPALAAPVAAAPASWVALAATETGFEVLAAGSEAEVRARFGEACGAGRSVLLCQVVAAVRGQGG